MATAVGARAGCVALHSSSSLQERAHKSPVLPLHGARSFSGRQLVCSKAAQANSKRAAGIQAAFPGLNNVPSEFRWENMSPELKANYANVPPSLFGLTEAQMNMFADDDSAVHRANVDNPDTLRAAAHYRNGGVWGAKNSSSVIRPPVMSGGVNMANTSMAFRGAGRAKGAPPDLPSLLLNARICYLGMPIVPAVTELIVAELLWLNFDSRDKPIYLYINSPGTQNENRESVGFETEAYAIADTLLYVKPKVHTLVIGHAYGQAAMLATLGTKGNRFMLPNSRMKIYAPKTNKSQGSAIDVWIKAKELEVNTRYYAGLLSYGTGKDFEQVKKDIQRPKYFDAKQAIEYGLVDHIIEDSNLRAEKRDYDQMMRESKKLRGEVIKPSAKSGLPSRPARI